jgi:histidyl-tRNA synthetase
VQCDIDIIGDDSIAAEAELLLASLSALRALGLSDAKIRVNHRDLLKRNIAQLGISESDAGSAMITIDKLDKLGVEGVAKELGEKFGAAVAIEATSWLQGLGGTTIPAELSELFQIMGEAASSLRYDASLVRGMGYYTGAIFEIEHPGSGSSIGGGGRYDGMVGRWLGSEVPAVGISLGFERIVDLVASEASSKSFQVLVYEQQDLALALSLQQEFVLRGVATRIEQRPKNLKALLSEMELAGASQFAIVGSDVSEIDSLEFKPLA